MNVLASARRLLRLLAPSPPAWPWGRVGGEPIPPAPQAGHPAPGRAVAGRRSRSGSPAQRFQAALELVESLCWPEGAGGGRRRRVDAGAGRAGEAQPGPRRLRDGGAAAARRAVARGAARPRRPRPLLRPDAGHLPARLLLGDPPARAGGRPCGGAGDGTRPRGRRPRSTSKRGPPRRSTPRRSGLFSPPGRARGIWGPDPVGTLDEYVAANDFPPRIRGTLRDAVSYLWTELLADRSLWSPAENNEIYRLDLAALIAGSEHGGRPRRSGGPPAAQARRRPRRPRGLAPGG